MRLAAERRNSTADSGRPLTRRLIRLNPDRPLNMVCLSMFTGIVEETGVVVGIRPTDKAIELTVRPGSARGAW